MLPLPADAPPVWCVGGRRGAPPVDCGHLTTVDDLTEIPDHPPYFSVDEINDTLR
ncbi:hypothetical protein K8O93_19095 [Gordonia bronchialis]|uniref:hypothetical protein n=1 Tax=Gordonia bronchialis TaxID=2054 RepID=UPI001CC02098|nr:hypothetical protein [Gordonia bronchialis]UAK37237.1 hypothetical protein K8O93_19095 [Gordonia bronchialis]